MQNSKSFKYNFSVFNKNGTRSDQKQTEDVLVMTESSIIILKI